MLYLVTNDIINIGSIFVKYTINTNITSSLESLHQHKCTNQTTVDLVKLNPSITTCLIANFTSTITAYFSTNIREEYDNLRFCIWVILFVKVENTVEVGSIVKLIANFVHEPQ